MKYICVNYVPTYEDRTSYARKAASAMFMLRARRMSTPFIIMFIAGMFFDLYLSVLAVCFFAISVITPAILRKEELKKGEKSAYATRPITVDFYNDHIVYINNPNEYFKGTDERHFAFKSIACVAESEEYIYFISFNSVVITIPKRVIDAQQYEMLKNLIQNVFASKYQKI